MVSVIMSDEQGAFGEVSVRQSLYLQVSRLRASGKFLAVIDEQVPAVVLIFRNTTAYLFCAAMDGDKQCEF